MPKTKKIFFVSVLAIAIFIDVHFLAGCGKLSPEFSSGWVIAGTFLQLYGARKLFRTLRSDAAVGAHIVPDDYVRYGFFRSKWFYAVLVIYMGCMVFSYGVSHPDSRTALKLGTKISSCPGGGELSS
ncbi:hypothetical protein [Janthinobacterium sp. P210006]|uniref:hypothetical protein n=1 Tax=Janthinobacterium sp. P210006 TaxID=3112939 RepID=UPI002E2686AF|nr:hypothetical protein [Janthinobacterium sp. P210006]